MWIEESTVSPTLIEKKDVEMRNCGNKNNSPPSPPSPTRPPSPPSPPSPTRPPSPPSPTSRLLPLAPPPLSLPIDLLPSQPSVRLGPLPRH